MHNLFFQNIALLISILLCFVNLSYADGISTETQFVIGGCGRYGINFKRLFDSEACYRIKNLRSFDLVYNDPDNPEDIGNGFEFNTRVRHDLNFLGESQIGTLSAFVRIQTDYDPGILDDFVLSVNGDNFATGLDAFEISLFRPKQSFHIGKLENAGARFISDGFTARGAESLNARSGLGAAYEQAWNDFTFRISLSDPRETTNETPIGPNAGLGIKRHFGNIETSFGFSLINIDDFVTIAPLPFVVRQGAPLLRRETAQYGYAFAFDLKYEKESWKNFAGLTYVKGAANDAIFAFSDGFDTLSLFAGVQKELDYSVALNADFSYVTALDSGLRHLNGVETAFNITWMPLHDWTFLAELGFDNVDNFGAGNGFFFKNRQEGELDFLLQVKNEF